MKRKIIAITLGVALLTVTGGVVAAQLSTDSPKRVSVNSEQPNETPVALEQGVSNEASVEAVQETTKPKTTPGVQTAAAEGEEEAPAEPTLVSTSRCAVFIVTQQKTNPDGSIYTSGNQNIYTVRTYSDESIVVSSPVVGYESNLKSCPNNEAPQSVGI